MDSTSPPITARSRLRRLTAGVLVVGGLMTFSLTDRAGAAAKTADGAVAAEAGRALQAFEAWDDDRNPADYVRFVHSRDRTASMTATELGVDPAGLARAWADVPADKQQALLAAMSQLGVPYRSIASEPGVGFDCSGLTIWAFAQADVEIPRVSGDQIRASDPVELDDAEPGDLVHYPGHIGIYLGLETFVHSPEPGSTVEARHVPERSLNFGSVVED